MFKKLCERKKITQIMKKNEMEFVSADFDVCLLDMILVFSEAGINQCQILSLLYTGITLGCLFKATTNPQFVAVSFKSGHIWDGLHHSVLLVFYQHKSQEWVN